MTVTKNKNISTLNYEAITNFFIENTQLEDTQLLEKKHISSDMIKSEYKYYHNAIMPDGYNRINNRLDEIEILIRTKVAHKDDIRQSKDEIICEQKAQMEEAKQFISQLMNVLDKKSTPRIFSIISLLGMAISASFLLSTIFLGEIIFTNIHFMISTIGFFLMYLMARLSSKLHYGKDV